MEDIENSDIGHNLRVASPAFLRFITNMDSSLSRWIQYRGVENDRGSLYFLFKSSQNSLNFKVYAGVNIHDIYDRLDIRFNDIYHYFRDLKYANIPECPIN